MGKRNNDKGVVGLRIVDCRHQKGMVNYYIEHSYYRTSNDSKQVYKGKLAMRLGLSNKEVDKLSFEALTKNRDPLTGDRLTFHDDKSVHAYDFNFHSPKGVSILSKLAGDERIGKAIMAAVNEAMKEVEKNAMCRVRKGGANYSRESRELLWAEMPDSHSRPVNGVPDPHEHCHCLVFNVTWDPIEKCQKVIKATQIKNNAPLLQAIYLSRLATEVEKLGYRIEKDGKGWDIAGIPSETKEKFSNRTKQIDDYVRDHGLVDACEMGAAGAKTRKGKNKLSQKEIQSNWDSRLTETEKNDLQKMKMRAIMNGPIVRISDPSIAREALSHSVEKNFERNSVATQPNLLAEALLYKPGKVSLDELTVLTGSSEFQTAKDKHGRKWVTTAAVLREEKSCIDYVYRNRGNGERLGSKQYRISDTRLSEEQRSAVHQILDSRDSVTALLGPAGSGKTTLIQEVQKGLNEAGHKVRFFAPSGRAVDVLKEDAFKADTIQSLLKADEISDEMRGKVIWVDEAGLLSFPQMSKLFSMAESAGCRIVMSGDQAQHTAVERGDALRVLLKHGGLNGPSISQIRRQKKEPLRDAISSLSNPERDFESVVNGFKKLEKEGCIHELQDEESRLANIADEYFESRQNEESCLVVSPTHIEGKKVTNAVRAKLQAEGKLQGPSKSFETLTDLSMDTADKRIAENYEAGLVVKFHRHCPNNLRAGQDYLVTKTTKDEVVIRKPNGLDAVLPLHLAERFGVFDRETIDLRKRDKVQLTAKYKSRSGRTHSNKSIFTVAGFTRKGEIKLNNGTILDPEFKQLTHGYVTTSHSSQGETVDRVIVAQSSASHNAASSEQFYVSCSRARENISVYTDDSEALLDNVLESCHRPSATELLEGDLRDKGELWEFREAIQRKHSYESLQQSVTSERDTKEPEQPREEPEIDHYGPQPTKVAKPDLISSMPVISLSPDLDI